MQKIHAVGRIRVLVPRAEEYSLAAVSWILYNRVGVATINGVDVDGFAWFRDEERHLVAFSALSPDLAFDPASDEPPMAEQQIISDAIFKPAVRGRRSTDIYTDVSGAS